MLLIIIMLLKSPGANNINNNTLSLIYLLNKNTFKRNLLFLLSLAFYRIYNVMW